MRNLIIAITLFSLILTGCNKTPTLPIEDQPLIEDSNVVEDETPATPLPTPIIPKTIKLIPDPVNQDPLALVDQVDVLSLESYPVQYRAEVVGNFRNGCESMGESTQKVVGTTIQISLTVQSQGEVCTQALVPFRESIPVNADGLQAGTYSLSVNGVTTQFQVQ